MSSPSTAYHLPSIAAMAGITLAASSYVISTTNSESQKRRRRIKSKIMKEREDKYILGLVNTGRSSFANSVLQAMATLPCLRSYLAELVDDHGDEAGAQVPPNEFILQSFAFALYSTIELLNRSPRRPTSIAPADILLALERKLQDRCDQQNAYELFQVISSILTLEEEIQYKQQVPSLLDIGTLRHFTEESEPLPASSLDIFESSSFSSVGTSSSMWSSFSVSTTGGNLNRRPRRPRNPFTGLAASKITCLKCGYTPPIRHHTFDSISLLPLQTVNSSLESCLATYTKIDILSDYECRKCTLAATLENLRDELKTLTDACSSTDTSNEELLKSTIILESHMNQLKKALQNNIEANLSGITLTPLDTASRTSKQTMFANPPKSLCIHLSTSKHHPSDRTQRKNSTVQFPEYLDLAPYTTNGYLSSQDPSASLGSYSFYNSDNSGTKSEPSTPRHGRTSQANLVYLRNMAGGVFAHDQKEGLNMILPPTRQSGEDGINKDSISNGRRPSIFPSLTTPLPTVRPIQYRLNAVIVHDGLGHYITYRRKKPPTEQDATRSPPQSMGGSGSRYENIHSFQRQYHHSQHQKQRQHYTTPPPPSKFWRCRDDTIDEVDIGTVLSSAPYLLFYERE